MKRASHSSEQLTIQGYTLNWQRWVPEETPVGATFFLHGQGDYSDRYEDIAHLFNEAGFSFVTCDLPGHGRSSGKRGHIPTLSIIDQVTAQGLKEASTLAKGGKVGLCGHSVGGLLALRALRTTAKTVDFSWLSSPLIDPESSQPAWKKALLRPLAGLFPSLTISTGVTADKCREYLPGESASEHLQFHNHISLFWGKTLIEVASDNRSNLGGYPEKLPLLLTQGGKDSICLPEICQNFVQQLPLENLRFEFYPESRHEPFADIDRENVSGALKDWLSNL